MSFFQVKTEIYEYSIRDADPEDRYDSGCTGADITVLGVELSEEYFDVALPKPYDPTKPLYLVWADYDTGDSFGRQGNRFEAVDIFQDEKRAQEAAAALRLDIKDQYNRNYIRDDGTEVKYGCPWTGYFERLNVLHVEKVEILGHDNTSNMIVCYQSREDVLQNERLKKKLKNVVPNLEQNKRKI